MFLSNSYIVTLAAMDGSGARLRTRLTALVAGASIALCACAPAALAQSAGDRQYSDPIVGDGGGSTDQPSETPSGPDTPTSSDDAPSTGSAAPSAPPPAGAEPATTSALPRTGADAGLLAAIGLTLLAAGALARPRPAPAARD
jgi:LPXTG-motif cell wall-anchored protein